MEFEETMPRSVKLSSLADFQYFDPEHQIACLEAQIEIYKEQNRILKSELKIRDRLFDRCIDGVRTAKPRDGKRTRRALNTKVRIN